MSDPSVPWEPTDEPEPRRKQLGAWGVSAIVHAALLLILGLITIAIEAPDVDTVIRPKLQQQRTPPLPSVVRDIINAQEIPEDKLIEDPIVPLEDVVIATDPIGKAPDLQTNKNLNHDMLMDPAGIGGGPAGARGNPHGLGNPAAIGFRPRSVEMADAALRWLARHQVERGPRAGSWSAADWHLECQDGGCEGMSLAEPGGIGPGRGNPHYDVGVTALALLAFLGRGNTARVGDFKAEVRKAQKWLIGQQDPATGAIGFDPSHGESMYNHAIATMALCEAYFYGDDHRLEEPAQAAVDFCVRAQNPNAGWRYGVMSGQSDTSVTGWMVLALKAARVADLEVPDETFAGARLWFDRVTTRDGQAGYNRPGSGSSVLKVLKDRGALYDEQPCMTAVAMLCRIFTGQDPDDREIKAGAEHLMEKLPVWDPDAHEQVNHYYWYYATYAMFQYGTKDWLTWNEAMLEALKASQRNGLDGSADAEGSWDPIGEWGFVGGRVYSTALNALTLQIYYRYKRQNEGR